MIRPDAGQPWRHGDACVIVYFRLTPKSSKNGVDGLSATAEGTAFQARVRAVPENGAANAALEKLVAEWLGVPKGLVQLVAGGRSRLKSVAVSGDVNELDQLLTARLSQFR